MIAQFLNSRITPPLIYANLLQFVLGHILSMALSWICPAAKINCVIWTDGNMGTIARAAWLSIDPGLQEIVLEKHCCRLMDFTSRPMKGYIMVDATGMKTKRDFEYWINLCLEFNKKAGASKKKKWNH